MKAELSKDKPKFTPVLITLETQKEVDGLYAFFRHAVSRFAGFDTKEYDTLCRFVSDEEAVFEKFHNQVETWKNRKP